MAFDLLTAEELTEIAQRAGERRDSAPLPWSVVYDTIFTLAHASLAHKRLYGFPEPDSGTSNAGRDASGVYPAA